MIADLNWGSLEDRRTETRIKLMQRITNGELEINTKHIFIPQESNRASRSNSNKLNRPLVKKDVLKYSFFKFIYLFFLFIYFSIYLSIYLFNYLFIYLFIYFVLVYLFFIYLLIYSFN